MNIYEKILRTLSFTIIIWEQYLDKYICKFSNQKSTTVQQGTYLEEHLINNPNLKSLYKKIFETKEEQHLVTNDQNIIIYYLHHDNIYYEVRTNMPKEIFKYIHLSYISNQIRGPLTTIMGALEALHEIGLTAKQMQQISLIEKSNFELISLTNDIVDIINISQNHIKLNLERGDFKKCIVESVEIVNYYAHNKKVNINFKMDKDIPTMLLFDAQRLKQILVNILTISLKNTEQGSINISIGLLKESIGHYDYIKVEPPKYNIFFKIKDTSNEMSNNDIESMENILGIKDHEIKTYNNYEFGLIISKYLCNLMSGNLWFENEPGFGTIYYFNLIA